MSAVRARAVGAAQAAAATDEGAAAARASEAAGGETLGVRRGITDELATGVAERRARGQRD